MNWIKQHPAQLSLAAISCGVLAGATALYFNAIAFPKLFLAHGNNAISNDSVPAINAAPLDQAIAAVNAPSVWKPRDPENDARLFAAKVYLLSDNQLKKPKGTVIHGDVPYDWLKRHGLDPLRPTVLSEDPDRDGFTTLQEWQGMDAVPHSTRGTTPLLDLSGKELPDDSTSPVDPASHPPYYTRLAVNRIETIPFRLRFMAADVDAKNPENTRMQINMLDLRMPTQYVPLGKDIAGTHFQTLTYEEKTAPGLDGTVRDVSELTILNKKTGEKLVLPKGVIVDSPESHAVIEYFWAPFGTASLSEGKPTVVFHRRKGETLTIPPVTSDTYRVAAIRGDEVDLLLPTGEIWTLKKTATVVRK